MALAAGYGLTADDWQADPVRCIFARRADGRWAAETTKVSVPRQNGKNGILEIVELFGMVVLGLKFLHTAHEVKTARKAFRRIASFFENKRRYPELAALVVEIRKTNGQEAIVLRCPACADAGEEQCDHGWGSIEFIARSSGSGRGFTVDVLVCDEDQDLTDDEQAALLPTISAAPSGNPMVILTGTPPDPSKPDAAKGEVARRVRGEALKAVELAAKSGEPVSSAQCVFDWGVPDGPLPDVADRALWWATNPAMHSGRLNEAEVEREFRMMSAEVFARERLGWCGDPKATGRTVVDLKEWANLIDRDAAAPGRASLVVDVSPGREWASIGAAADHEDGRTLLLARREAGTGWVVPALVAMRAAGKELGEVGLTPGQAEALAADLTEAGIGHKVLTTKDVGAACAAFQTGVPARRFVHVGQNEVATAIRDAITRYAGEVEVWDRRNPKGDTTALVSIATAALRHRSAGPPPTPSSYEDHGLEVV